MPALDSMVLLLVPLSAAEAFMLWALWNFVRQSRKRKRISPGIAISSKARKASVPEVLTFPESGSVVPAEKPSSSFVNSSSGYFAATGGVSASSPASSTSTAEPGTTSKLAASFPVG